MAKIVGAPHAGAHATFGRTVTRVRRSRSRHVVGGGRRAGSKTSCCGSLRDVRLRAAAGLILLAAGAHAGPALSPEIALGPTRGVDGGTRSSATAPHVAWVAGSPGYYAVVWDDILPNATDQIRGARVTATGEVSGELGIEVTPGVRRDYAMVAPLGTGFIAAWQEYPANSVVIAYRRFAFDGTPLGTAETFGPQGARTYSPALAASPDAGVAALAYQSDRAGGHDIWVDRVDAQGNRLDDGGLRITSRQEDEQYPWISSTASDFVVTFRRDPNVTGDPLFARVTHGGQVVDLEGARLGPTNGFQNAPRHACNATRCLHAWEDATNGQSNDIFGTFTSGGLPLGDGGNLTNMPGDQTTTSVAWLGDRFYLIWLDERADAGPGYFGREVHSDGELGSIYAIANGADHGRLASDGHGGALLVYDRFDPALNTRRVFARLLGPRADGARCASDSDCQGECGDERRCVPESDDDDRDEARHLTAGCGCGASSGASLLLALVAMLRRRRRRVDSPLHRRSRRCA